MHVIKECCIVYDIQCTLKFYLLYFDGTNEQLLTIKSLGGGNPIHHTYSFIYKFSLQVFIKRISHTFLILKYLCLPPYLNLSKCSILQAPVSFTTLMPTSPMTTILDVTCEPLTTFNICKFGTQRFIYQHNLYSVF